MTRTKKEQPVKQGTIRGGRSITVVELVDLYNPLKFEKTDARVIHEAEYEDGTRELTIKLRFKHLED